MRILLIRHATVELLGRVLYGRLPGIHLSDEGLRQAQQLAEALKQRYRIDAVVSSPLERARETARCIAEAQDIEVSIEEGINELDMGKWIGKSFDELFDTDAWKRYNGLRSINSPPGGEFILEVQTRAWETVQAIAARYQNAEDTTVALVSHGDVIRALLLLLLGMPVDHIHRLEIAPASVSEVLLGRGQPRVLTVNRTF